MKAKICKLCKGTGEIEIDISTHNSNYKIEKCTSCNGTGKVLKGSYSYQIPFNVDKTLVYKIDKQIMDLIRKLEK